MIQGRVCENRNEFAHHLDLALKGVPSSQGVVRETVMSTIGYSERITEAVTSDMVAGWFTSVAQTEFETQYAEQSTTWDKFASVQALSNFRPTQLYELDHDIDATLLRDNGGEVVVPETMPRIPELTPYPTFGYKAGGRWIEVHKNGVRLQMSWEAFINDDWDLIARFPKDAAFLASRTVDAAVYGALFSLSLKPVADMITAMTSIEHKAKNADGSLSNKTILSATPTASVEVVESDLVGLLGGNDQGDTNWVLAPAGGRTATRRTILRTTLLGMDGVELRAAANQGTSLGGGALSATSGSFDNDDIQFRARMISGGAVLHTDGIVASTGKGA